MADAAASARPSASAHTSPWLATARPVIVNGTSFARAPLPLPPPQQQQQQQQPPPAPFVGAVAGHARKGHQPSKSGPLPAGHRLPIGSGGGGGGAGVEEAGPSRLPAGMQNGERAPSAVPADQHPPPSGQYHHGDDARGWGARPLSSGCVNQGKWPRAQQRSFDPCDCERCTYASRSILVRRLPGKAVSSETKRRVLRDHFSRWGHVQDCWIRGGNMGNTQAFVRFACEESAVNAVDSADGKPIEPLTSSARVEHPYFSKHYRPYFPSPPCGRPAHRKREPPGPGFVVQPPDGRNAPVPSVSTSSDGSEKAPTPPPATPTRPRAPPAASSTERRPSPPGLNPAAPLPAGTSPPTAGRPVVLPPGPVPNGPAPPGPPPARTTPPGPPRPMLAPSPASTSPAREWTTPPGPGHPALPAGPAAPGSGRSATTMAPAGHFPGPGRRPNAHARPFIPHRHAQAPWSAGHAQHGGMYPRDFSHQQYPHPAHPVHGPPAPPMPFHGQQPPPYWPAMPVPHGQEPFHYSPHPHQPQPPPPVFPQPGAPQLHHQNRPHGMGQIPHNSPLRQGGDAGAPPVQARAPAGARPAAPVPVLRHDAASAAEPAEAEVQSKPPIEEAFPQDYSPGRGPAGAFPTSPARSIRVRLPSVSPDKARAGSPAKQEPAAARSHRDDAAPATSAPTPQRTRRTLVRSITFGDITVTDLTFEKRVAA